MASGNRMPPMVSAVRDSNSPVSAIRVPQFGAQARDRLRARLERVDPGVIPKGKSRRIAERYAARPKGPFLQAWSPSRGNPRPVPNGLPACRSARGASGDQFRQVRTTGCSEPWFEARPRVCSLTRPGCADYRLHAAMISAASLPTISISLGLAPAKPRTRAGATRACIM